MTDDSVVTFEKPEQDPLTELIRNGAKRLIERAIQAELDELLDRFADRRTEDGRRGVVRNGFQPEREILTGVGPVTVKIPKVRSRLDEPVVFQTRWALSYLRGPLTRSQIQTLMEPRKAAMESASAAATSMPGCGW